MAVRSPCQFLNTVRYSECAFERGQSPPRAVRPERVRGGRGPAAAGGGGIPDTIEVASCNSRLKGGKCFSKRSIGAAIKSPAGKPPTALKIGAPTPPAAGTVS